MAVVSITIPDAVIPRVVAAMRASYPQHAALTDVQAFRKVTADMWRNLVANYEGLAAEATARETALADASGIG